MAEPTAPRGFTVDKNDGRKVLPGSLHANRRLSQWLRLDRDGTARVFTGKVELGQGILTALAMIAAEELDLPVDRIRMQSATTTGGPDEGMTSGSLSIQDSGQAIRHVCADVRAMLLRKFAPRDDLTVVDGRVVSADGETLGSYADSLEPSDLDVEATAEALPKSAAERRLVGKSRTPRVDLPDKVFGIGRFVQDLEFDAMLHGRIVRPPSPSARLLAPPRSDDADAHVVVDGRFVGVVAPTERGAVKAAAALRSAARWSETAELPDPADLRAFLLAAPRETLLVQRCGATPPTTPGEWTHEAEYLKPYLAHASIGTSCAVAHWTGSTLQLWTHSQGIQNLRDDILTALSRDGLSLHRDDIVVRHVEGSGCYGHNGADDAAFDAVLLALRVPGRHVRVLWSRADELSCSPMAPAHLVRLSATVDPHGRILRWHHQLWANGYSSRPGRATIPTLLAAGHRAGGEPPPLAINAPLSAGGGAERNAVPAYRVPDVTVVNHRLLAMPIRTSAMRALGAYANVFAIESFIDELAHRQGIDPIEFRRRHLQDERALAVIDAVLAGSTWWEAPREARAEGVGHGFAWARYKNTGAWCAVIARIEAGEAIRVLDLDLAVDVGQVIDADGVVNQIEGGALQSASWTLKEQVTFDRTRITSHEWAAYPILRFGEIPTVKVTVLDRPESPPLGAGEAAQGPVAAAIANAVHDALGLRVRRLPLDRTNIMAAMDR